LKNKFTHEKRFQSVPHAWIQFKKEKKETRQVLEERIRIFHKISWQNHQCFAIACFGLLIKG
jgi:hypothetical protein